MKVKDMNKEQRPREHALQDGIEALNNRELVAILLRSGSKTRSALEVADEVLAKMEHLGELGVAQLNDLMEIDGIAQAKALELQAAFELGRRIAFDKVKQMHCINSPKDIVDWLNQQIGFMKQEHFLVLFLNHHNQIVSYRTMFKGSMTSASVHPREIYKEALASGCAKIICEHNHPSGNVEPSEADILLTEAIDACGKMTCIPLVDHIIVGKNSYTSLRQKQLID